MSLDLKRCASPENDASCARHKKAKTEGEQSQEVTSNSTLFHTLEAVKSTWLVLDGMSNGQVAQALLQRLSIRHPELTAAMIAVALVKFRDPEVVNKHTRMREAEKCLPKNTAKLPVHRVLYSATCMSGYSDMSSFLMWLDADLRLLLLEEVTQNNATLCTAVQHTLPFWHWMNGSFSTDNIQNDEIIQFEKAGIPLCIEEKARLAKRWKELHSPLWFYTLDTSMQAAVLASYLCTH
jgi:hypothetical protein